MLKLNRNQIFVAEPADQATESLVPEPRRTKSAAVLTPLQRKDGATLPELIEATGWLPHTTRAALTGLRKTGHVLEKSLRWDHLPQRRSGMQDIEAEVNGDDFHSSYVQILAMS